MRCFFAKCLHCILFQPVITVNKHNPLGICQLHSFVSCSRCPLIFLMKYLYSIIIFLQLPADFQTVIRAPIIHKNNLKFTHRLCTYTANALFYIIFCIINRNDNADFCLLLHSYIFIPSSTFNPAVYGFNRSYLFCFNLEKIPGHFSFTI